jgi:NADPH:quinone reductase-like Zn-dependent oxidoreductase
MKAVVYTKYGPPDVLHMQEVAKPTPKANEILVRVHAAPVNFGDLLARDFASVSPGEFNMPALLWLPSRLAFGWNKPKKMILGSEFSGEVEAIGSAVTRFKPGDAVYGYMGQAMGAYAEFLCISEDKAIARKPANMTHAEAATVPYGAIMARNLLEKANLQPGQKVLINGASGSIGAAAVQLAKHAGAEVTGVCSTRRLAYVKALGADKVIDYTVEEFTGNGETYDLIFDVLGRSSFSKCADSLKPGGIYLLASFKTNALMQMMRTSLGGDKKVICALASEQPGDLDFIRELIEAGQYKAIVDKCFPLDEAAAAHRYVEDGLKQGAVVIGVAPNGKE